MDTEILRTFLEVNRTRHFGKAADNLFVTQAAVSTRIRYLEQHLGVPVFTRARNNIQLTVAGQKLLEHAETMLNTWNRARQELAVESEDKLALTVGAVPSLWDMMVQEWIETLYSTIPKLVINAELSSSTELLKQTIEGTVDLAVMYESTQAKALIAEELSTIHLVMVSTEPNISSADAISDKYAYVDWGTSFSIAHARAYPDLPAPVFRSGTGRLARSFILERGGSAYLAQKLVAEDLTAGRLHLVNDAPSIARLAYAVYVFESRRHALIQKAIRMLRKIAARKY